LTEGGNYGWMDGWKLDGSMDIGMDGWMDGQIMDIGMDD